MPVLGYGQVSSIAPNAISAGYAGIVKNLQQTGQEIAANVQRVQTNKQVTALGQEMATIDPYSPQFPQQMLAVATKYPMALADQRGQALMGVLGIAHKDYLAQKADERNFGQAVSLAGINNQFRVNADNTNFEQQKELERMREEARLKEIGARPVTPQRPVVVPKGATVLSPDGEVLLAPETGGTGGLTPDQAAKAGTAQERARIAALNAQGNQINHALTGLNSEYQNLTQELEKTQNDKRKQEIPGRLAAIWDETDYLRRQLKKIAGVGEQPKGFGKLIEPAMSAPTLGGLNPIQAPASVAVPVTDVPLVPDGLIPPPPLPATRPSRGSDWINRNKKLP